jgi:hypothetical protein
MRSALRPCGRPARVITDPGLVGTIITRFVTT